MKMNVDYFTLVALFVCSLISVFTLLITNGNKATKIKILERELLLSKSEVSRKIEIIKSTDLVNEKSQKVIDSLTEYNNFLSEINANDERVINELKVNNEKYIALIEKQHRDNQTLIKTQTKLLQEGFKK